MGGAKGEVGGTGSGSAPNHSTTPAAIPPPPPPNRSKKNALRTALRVSDLLVYSVDGGVQELFVNEKRIELEVRDLLDSIARYKKQTDQWLAATNAINSVLKEIGDFESWIKIMDFDCKSINATIRNIHQA